MTFPVICWHSNLPVRGKNALLKVVNVASKIVGVKLSGLSEMFYKQLLNKARLITRVFHPFNAEYILPPSAFRTQL